MINDNVDWLGIDWDLHADICYSCTKYHHPARVLYQFVGLWGTGMKFKMYMYDIQRFLSDLEMKHSWLNIPDMKLAVPHRWQVNIKRGNGVAISRRKPSIGCWCRKVSVLPVTVYHWALYSIDKMSGLSNFRPEGPRDMLHEMVKSKLCGLMNTRDDVMIWMRLPYDLSNHNAANFIKIVTIVTP